MPLLNCCKVQESPTDVDKGRLVMREARMPVIWVFGGRCSGKTTLCMKLIEKYNLLHIDCDNVLRFEALRQSSRGVDIMARLNRREKLPHDILVKLLREVMPRHVKVTKGYILDNFPVNLEQARMFEDKVSIATMLIYLKVSDNIMLKRYKMRESDHKESVNVRNSATDMFYRPLAVRDVTLQQDSIENQLADFSSGSVAVLHEYANILRTVNGERKKDDVFVEADKAIRELKKIFDIPDKGNLNYTLHQNILIDKSELPEERRISDTPSDIDDHYNMALALPGTSKKIAQVIQPEARGTSIMGALQVADYDGDPHAAVIAKAAKETAARELQEREAEAKAKEAEAKAKEAEAKAKRDSVKSDRRRSSQPARSTLKLEQPSNKGSLSITEDKKDRRKSSATKPEVKPSDAGSDKSSSGKSSIRTTESDKSPGNKGLSIRIATDRPEVDKDTRHRGTMISTGSGPKVRDSFLPNAKRNERVRKSAAGRYSEDVADSTIASPQTSQKFSLQKQPQAGAKPTDSKKKDARLRQQGVFKKDERYN